MAVDQEAREALDLNSLQLPSELPVVRLEVEDYTDWSGEPALKVWVILDESVEIDIDKGLGEAVSRLKASIHDRLLDHGITLFPYIFLAKQSELDELDEVEQADDEE
jgi:hypothetical protein